jgi:hypothetical protein
MKKHPYRPLPKADPAETVPSTFVFNAVDRGSKQALGGLGVLQVVFLPFTAAAIVYALTDSSIGAVAALAVAFVLMLRWWRKKTVGDKFVFELERGVLLVSSASMAERVPLADLLSVDLETKTIQRVEEGGSMIPAMRFADPRVGLEVDTCRVVLETATKTIPLGNLFVAHMDATESLGKLRVFLRKHGWLPESERDADPEVHLPPPSQALDPP